MTAESLPRQSKFCYRDAANSFVLSFFPHKSLFHTLLCPSFLPLYHPLFTPRPRWHLPGAPACSQGSPCCSARVGARGFMVHIHQHHMPGFMGDGVQTWLLWIRLAEADLWAVVGYNGWASFHPTPTSTYCTSPSVSPFLSHTLQFSARVSSLFRHLSPGWSWSFI